MGITGLLGLRRKDFALAGFVTFSVAYILSVASTLLRPPSGLYERARLQEMMNQTPITAPAPNHTSETLQLAQSQPEISQEDSSQETQNIAENLMCPYNPEHDPLKKYITETQICLYNPEYNPLEEHLQACLYNPKDNPLEKYILEKGLRHVWLSYPIHRGPLTVRCPDGRVIENHLPTGGIADISALRETEDSIEARIVVLGETNKDLEGCYIDILPKPKSIEEVLGFSVDTDELYTYSSPMVEKDENDNITNIVRVLERDQRITFLGDFIGKHTDAYGKVTVWARIGTIDGVPVDGEEYVAPVIKDQPTIGSHSYFLSNEGRFTNDPGHLDEIVRRLMLTIRIIETGLNPDDYTKSNPHSGAYGAYQFMHETWKSAALRYFGKYVPKTRLNQDIMAYLCMWDLFNKIRNAGGEAVAWYAGPFRQDYGDYGRQDPATMVYGTYKNPWLYTSDDNYKNLAEIIFQVLGGYNRLYKNPLEGKPFHLPEDCFPSIKLPCVSNN